MSTSLHSNPVKDFTSVNVEERKYLNLKSGDTVKVWIKIQEKDKVRLQPFEGLVLSVKHGSEAGATFTVRRVSNGVGIEKIFPLFSPMIDKIEVIKKAKVRKSNLYHIRQKVAREIKRQMRRAKIVRISTSSDIEETERRLKEAEEEAKKTEEEAKTKAEAEEKATKEAEEAAKKEAEKTETEEVKEKEVKEGSKEDDLTKIEGVGPKIAEVFAENGIKSFSELAAAKIEDLEKILTDHSLGSHNPGTWSQQASMASEGKWSELKKLQEELDGGK